MWKIKILALIFLFGASCFYYSQSKKNTPSRFKYVKIGNMEGKIDATDFKFLGSETKYMQLLQEFEKSFSKINKGYPNYYRDYRFIEYTSPKYLKVSLIPKQIVSNEDKKKLYLWNIPLDTKVLEVYYNIKTKKIDDILETTPGTIE
ncbi:hypothetical protein I6H88_18305 [Elizabethkingia bruuniana]|uniref:Lipoprotein n=2 Tax=Elizabethkingia bruuniana TaxID=1756149 RepID=A0A7T7ZXR7_9FLAO|nr:hypothetical protein AYC65_07605 [Elizabethkingia bruuniana]KGO10928.1 hypothetical protein KS04_06600 [Elizabethkingia miricola]KUY28934.1 hypothetical protein ATB97_02065 [Elizabethkingia bruuniana]OPB70564.1 hypothetical protein BAY12_18175 [Elizabethkingia bruuniana]QQN58359.1 hypothetical protein I6H88_18305 [Elizabethkingia bruuniana]